ncbi:hypothetical protein ACIB24_06700 [Spongisporangium articulatum]|uniref:Transcriptional regulator, AbiEi antitoxin, Type IV TA system n=1 Tax=Spongisporangium articulatum TaxID=3362603 RepID=A0ABW8AK62_9ACTN
MSILVGVTRLAERLHSTVESLGGVALHSELVEAGFGRRSIQWAREKGYLVPLGRGIFTTARLWAHADGRLRHALKVRARQRRNPMLVAVGPSAAALRGWPLPYGPPDVPILSLPRDLDHRGAPGRQGNVLLRRSFLGYGEVVSRDGLLLTNPVRTVIDCARQLGPTWGLAIGDVALQRCDIGRLEILAHLEGSPGASGNRAARWVAEHVRRGPESVLESLARAVIVLGGFPEPTPQVWVATRRGAFRVDLMDEANRVVTEADGRLKYRVDDEDPDAAVWEEKLRQDAIRDERFEVERFVMADHGRRRAFLGRYAEAVARGRRLS